MEYIDHIVYINLNHREDRKNHMEEQIHKYNLKNVERFEAIYIPAQGILGCGMSHLQVLRNAKTRNLQNVLILEDDFKFLVDPPEFQTMLRTLFESKIDFDVCFLSYHINESEPIDSNFGRALFTQTASGYIVQNHYFQALIDLYEEAMPLLQSTKMHWLYANDIVWKDLQKKDRWIYFIHRIGMQMPSYSDNANEFVSPKG